MNSNQFEIVSDRVIVSDPCYEKHSACQLVLDNVHKGYWTLDLIHIDSGDWGRRVSELVCTANCAVEDCFPETGWRSIGYMAVDSGQGGVFDAGYYKDDNAIIDSEMAHHESPIIDSDEDGARWYNFCCDRTLADIFDGGSVIPYGAVSSSGYGDGNYEVFVKYAKDKTIVAIRIVFITDDDEAIQNDDEPDVWEPSYCPICGNELNSLLQCSKCEEKERD